jgi:cytoskeletal protein RodZ
MVGLDNPDENYTQGPAMSFQVTAAPAPVKKPFPWWLVVVAAIVLVAVIAVVAIINSRSQVGTPTTTSTVDANAAATQDAINASAAARQAGATATAEFIATALARLAVIDQAAATATAQAIASQPSVALQATNGVVTITNVSINGGGNVAMLAPGSAFEVGMDYFIIDIACPGCIDQIQVGFSTATPDQCAYSGVPGPAGVSGSGVVNLTAPTQPGVYYIGFDRSQDFSCPKHWWSGAPDVSRYIAAIVVK